MSALSSQSKTVTLVTAGSLNADDIGHQIRFRQWDNTTETATVITAELRQISHTDALTSLTYGHGADQEATLDPDQPVSMRPPKDYHDVQQLAEYDTQV